MIEQHTSGFSNTFYELGRFFLIFGMIGFGTWLVTKLIQRSGKRGSSNKHLGINRQQRRAERAKKKRTRR